VEKDGAQMAFIVRPESGLRGEGAFLAEKATRKDAVETGLMGQGMTGVAITDENGRVFAPADFAVFFRV
jgi:hypothetical protein